MITITIDGHSAEHVRAEMARLLGTTAPAPSADMKRVLTGDAQVDHDTMVEEEAVAAAGEMAQVIAETAFVPTGGKTAPTRERGKPSPGHARRTKAEIAEDDAAQAAEDAIKKADAERERGAISETPEDRVDPNNPDETDSAEDAAADAADEAAETAAAQAKSGGKLTLDSVRTVLGIYVQKFGLDAAQEDGPKVLKMVCGETVAKISAIPDDQEIIGKVVSGIEEMTTKNPFKRAAVS